MGNLIFKIYRLPIVKIILIFINMTAFHPSSLGQVKKGHNYEKTANQLDRKVWKELQKKLNYEDDKAEEKREIEKKIKPVSSFKVNSGLAKTLFFILASVVLVFLLIRFIPKRGGSENYVKEKNYSLENLEEKIHETDLEAILKEAINRNDFRQAVRIYYLITIRDLSNRNYISWKKDKTNHQYLTEMSTKASFEGFDELTVLFERVWYGRNNISENQYIAIEKKFLEYFVNINNTALKNS